MEGRKVSLTKHITTLALLSVIMTLLLIFNMRLAAQPAEDITIKGKVVPVEWNKKGEIKTVAIRVMTSEDKSTDMIYMLEMTFKNYYVKSSKIGRRLSGLVGKYVIVSGAVKENKKCDCTTIDIKSYEIIEKEIGSTLLLEKNDF